MASGAPSVGRLLLGRGLIDDSQLAWAERQAPHAGGVAAALLDAGLVTEIELVEAAAEHLGLPFVDLDAGSLPPAPPFSEATARRARAVAFAFDEGTVSVAMADPSDGEALALLRAASGARTVLPALAAPAAVERAWLRAYSPQRLAGAGEAATTPGPRRQLDALLACLVEAGGSDLHLSAGAPPTLRVNGGLQPVAGAAVLDAATCRALVLAGMSAGGHERFEHDLELDATHVVAGIGRFRLNAFVQQGNVSGALRHIPLDIPLLATLGLPSSVADLVTAPRGLVLVTGPTGSGKSTTLASMVDRINRTRAVHIVTVEDPIEYVHQHRSGVVNQREVGTDTHSFTSALKHVLRQDPDVILIGELRDLETISIALTAAETGHLVLATLHTQSAAQAVDRIVDVFPPHQQQQIRTQLSSTLHGVVSQQLVPTTEGCRVAAAEVLIGTTATRSLIRDGKTYQIPSVMQSGSAHGMQTMDQSLASLVRAGRVTMPIALEHCHDSDGLRQLVGSRRADARPPLATSGSR